MNRMSILALPVGANTSSQTRRHVAGQVRHGDPRQHQKARVVGQRPQVRLPSAASPADPGVARRTLPRRRVEQRATHRPARAVADQIPDILTHRVTVAQVVVAAEQAVEQPQVCRTRFNDTHGQRPQVTQRAADGCGRMIHQGRVTVSKPVGRRSATIRQLDEAATFHLQQQRASGHILDAAACVAPIPQTAKLFAEPGSTPVAVHSEEPLNQSDVPGAQFPSMYHHVPPCTTMPPVMVHTVQHERVRVRQQNQLSFACLARWGGTLLIMQVGSGDVYLSSYFHFNCGINRLNPVIEQPTRGKLFQIFFRSHSGPW